MKTHSKPITLQGEPRAIKLDQKNFLSDQNNLSPPLVLEGPWDGLGAETPLPSIMGLAKASVHEKFKKKNP
jgi:hypothetical protein